jgi:ABC-type glutathione transport system ATPase component
MSTGRLSRTRRQDDVSYLGENSKSLTPESAASNSKKDAKPIVALRDEDNKPIFSANDANTLLTRLGDSTVQYKLERCDVVDLPRLTVTRAVKASGGKTAVLTRQFSQLSLGQQQSVLLALMLSAGNPAPKAAGEVRYAAAAT